MLYQCVIQPVANCRCKFEVPWHGYVDSFVHVRVHLVLRRRYGQLLELRGKLRYLNVLLDRIEGIFKGFAGVQDQQWQNIVYVSTCPKGSAEQNLHRARVDLGRSTGCYLESLVLFEGDFELGLERSRI